MKNKLLRKTIAIAMLAIMMLSMLPAHAVVTGVINTSTTVYEKPNSTSKVVGYAKGNVTILYQNNDGTMYQISVTDAQGDSVTGWVPKSAVNGFVNSNGSGSTSTPGYSGTAASGAVTGTITGTIVDKTTIYTDGGSPVASVTGAVTVNHRNSDGSKLNVTADTGSKKYTGWVNASAVAALASRGNRVEIAYIPTSSSAVTSTTGSTAAYNAYSSAKYGTSKDSTIIIRKAALSSTSSSNRVTKVSSAKGKVFSILGTDNSGNYYYTNYNGYTGFVRASDFTLSDSNPSGTTSGTVSGTTGTTAGTTNYTTTTVAAATDNNIWMRAEPSKTAAVLTKLRGTTGEVFTLKGESGDWYLAEYKSYSGYVRKQDFTIVDPNAAKNTAAAGKSTTTSGATSVGNGSSSEKWGSITIPGSGTYAIYGNYTNSAGNKYYYDYNNIKSYNYVHTTTAKNSQIACVMIHNMRKSKSYGHYLHHVQNAILGGKKCESCGASCTSSSLTGNISANWEGYKSWEVVCFYEIPKGNSTSILTSNARPWNNSTEGYISTQISYAKQSGLKGWVKSGFSASSSGQYMMLITCGDIYDSSSNSTAKLYMLLRAVN